MKLLQRVAEIEGVSLLLLFCVAMPLKYAAGLPIAVRIAGSLHGLLFLVLISIAFRVWLEKEAPASRVARTLAWSFVPFGFLMTRDELKAR
jgi:integral membrane protein